jgi:hypothetical protein
MRKIRSKPGMLVWREDEDGRSISHIRDLLHGNFSGIAKI